MTVKEFLAELNKFDPKVHEDWPMLVFVSTDGKVGGKFKLYEVTGVSTDHAPVTIYVADGAT